MYLQIIFWYESYFSLTWILIKHAIGIAVEVVSSTIGFSVVSSMIISSPLEVGQSSAQYPNSFWLAIWFPLESTLVEHHLLELSSWSIGQPTKVNQVINSWFLNLILV